MNSDYSLLTALHTNLVSCIYKHYSGLQASSLTYVPDSQTSPLTYVSGPQTSSLTYVSGPQTSTLTYVSRHGNQARPRLSHGAGTG